MSTSIKFSMACNLGCKYCYENDIRNAGNAKSALSYDKEAMTKTLVKELMNDPHKGGAIFHGGEPLLMPVDDLEHFLKLSYELHGKSLIQTNGELITDEHIELFKKYKCGVGLSIDGTKELNRGRWKQSEEITDKASEKVWNNLKKLRDSKINVGCILVINKNNGILERRQAFKDFLLELKSLGIQTGRLNPAHVDGEYKQELELTPDELAEFWVDIANFCYEHELEYNPISDVYDSLLNLGTGTCFFEKCDAYHTTAEQGVQSDGTMGNCLMPAKEGIIFLQDEFGESHERYEVLKNLPVEQGGCGGCRYWNICTGLCPGEGSDDNGEFDIRAKSRWCKSYYALYENVENRLRKTIKNVVLQTDINAGEGVDDLIIAPTVTFEKMAVHLKSGRLSDRGDIKIDVHERMHQGLAIPNSIFKESAKIFHKKQQLEAEGKTEPEVEIPNTIEFDMPMLESLLSGQVIKVQVKEGNDTNE